MMKMVKWHLENEMSVKVLDQDAVHKMSQEEDLKNRLLCIEMSDVDF